MDRRSFLTDLARGGLALACGGLLRRAELFAQGSDPSRLKATGYGDLFPTATRNTGETYLALPKGFEYNVIGKVGGSMSDGRPTPPLHDGMHTFQVGVELRVVRNHEVVAGKIPHPGSAIAPQNSYDEACGGGTTTLVVDPKTREIRRDFVSLSGTLINCCGGPTPWGSWISCEETTLGPTVRADKTGGFAKPHGYCFEVPASSNSNLPAVPLRAMGRFTHEAVAIDNRTGTAYLTEDYDNPLGVGFYRFLPKRNSRLAAGGQLQALSIVGKSNFDARRGQKMGTRFDAAWVTIDDPDPEKADVDPASVFRQGLAKGAAVFSRLEGCAADGRGNIYFSSTDGGDNRGGQIWLYEPVNKDSGRLTLAFESPDREVLDMPDNLCLRPGTGHLFICEDSDYIGAGGTPENFLRILAPEGRMASLAKNITPNMLRAEFAGATFSRDGKTLFVNVQQVGATFAIWGPWDAFRA